MFKNSKPYKNGFMLVELVIVIVIIGILSAFAILKMPAVIDRAAVIADLASLRTLNTATGVYKLSEMIFKDDIFDGITTDKLRLAALINGSYIDKIPIPNVKDKYFTWDIGAQKWNFGTSEPGIHVLTTSEVTMGIDGFTGFVRGSYSGEASDIIIPRTMDGILVKAIWQDVFKSKGLTSIAFDENSAIERIHARAFQNNNLTEVTFPDSLTRIDYAAFANNNISKVTIGSGVTLESNVFQNNDKFKTTYTAQGAGTYVYAGGEWVKQ